MIYIVENKRKGEQFDSAGTTAKQKRPASEQSISDLQKTSDLVILGLAYTASESDLKDYFDSFGTVLMTQVWDSYFMLFVIFPLLDFLSKHRLGSQTYGSRISQT